MQGAKICTSFGHSLYFKFRYMQSLVKDVFLSLLTHIEMLSAEAQINTY